MKKNLIALVVAAGVIAPVSARAADSGNAGPTVFGYAQITGSQQVGTGPGTSNGLVVGGNRIRLGFKGEVVPGVTYLIQGAYDDVGLGNGLPNGLDDGSSGNMLGGNSAQLKDVWINYAPLPFAQLQVGKFKTPEGLEYTSVAGNELTFIYRNLGQSLLPGRSAGAMLHADNVMGTDIGYAVGMFDNASLDNDTAFSNGKVFGGGQDGILNGNGMYIASGMLKYSMDPLLTAEVSGSMGTAETHVGSDSLDSWNVGVHGGLMGIKYAAGYTRTNGSNTLPYMGSLPNSIGTVNASDWHVDLAANLHEMTLSPDWLDVESAVRYDQYHGTGAGTLGNITVGLNYFVNPKNPHAAEIQVNYIMATRGSSINQDYGFSTNGMAPINGVAYNTLALQFQAGF